MFDTFVLCLQEHITDATVVAALVKPPAGANFPRPKNDTTGAGRSCR
jgi:hypothetical protein